MEESDEFIEITKRKWKKKRPGALDAQLNKIESEFGVHLPRDYCELMRWSNGIEEVVGGRLLSLWRAEEIALLNTDYQIQIYLPRMLGIGTDGGGTCYAFDYRKSKEAPIFVEFPLGDMTSESVVVCGSSLSECMSRWHNAT